MGYTTDFQGEFLLDRALRSDHKAYLCRFNEVRHAALDAEKLKDCPDPLRELVGLPIGTNGMYFTGESKDPHAGFFDGPMQKHALKRSLTRREQQKQANDPDWSPPSHYCQWVPTRHGRGIAWDGGEKFYGYRAWLNFLLDHFLMPWGYQLTGEVKYCGEQGEHGRILVQNNKVSIIVDGDSTLSRPQNISGMEEVRKIHWMTVGAISDPARKALLEIDGIVRDLLDTPPIVLIGIPYDCNYYKRHDHDDLLIWREEGIHLRSKRLSLDFDLPGIEEIEQNWTGTPTERLILRGELDAPEFPSFAYRLQQDPSRLKEIDF